MRVTITSSVLLALSLATFSVSGTPALDKRNVHKPSPVAASDFIKVDGLRLKDSKGKPHYLTGINYWAAMNLAADDEFGGQHARFIKELDQMASKGINHLRTMAASEGNPVLQPFRMTPALQELPRKYNEGIFVGLDQTLAEMAKRGMRATMTLNDQWQWSGGFAQYISWANNNEAISYPPSWNLTAPPQRAGKLSGAGWGNYTTTGTFSDYVDYGNQLYTNAQAEEWYKAHIEKVLNRRNTVNGRLISQFIKERAPKQLVNVGFEGKQGEWYWRKVHEAEAVDYGTTRAWVQNWGIYDMNNSTRANLEAAKTFVDAFISNSSRWAAKIGKPILLEEFGMARNNWLNKVTKGEYEYASKATTTHRDEYFAHLIGLVVSDYEKGGAYIGSAPWAYGGIYRPETQQANEFGQVWAGDLPHEAPG